MMSIRKYSAGTEAPILSDDSKARAVRGSTDLLPCVLNGYRAALAGMGRAGTRACAGTEGSLEGGLTEASQSLAMATTAEQFAMADKSIQAELENWAQKTERYYAQKAGEVKQILLAVARASESIGQRDQRCGQQLHDVTSNLKRIATFEDISQIRISIEKSAQELKHSIDRMTAEGKAALDDLHSQVSAFQSRLQEAEYAASTDPLTGLHNRLWIEAQIADRIEAGCAFCIALIDLDGFKGINDLHGHVVGDEVLKQFAAELRKASRSAGVVARWGGDEFLLMLDLPLAPAQGQVERVRHWICDRYSVQGKSGALMIGVHASVGLVEFAPPESMKCLLQRADSAMYAKKARTA